MHFKLKFPVVGPDGAPFSLRQTLLGPDATRAWIHLAYEGTWSGHPAGEFEFTRDTFSRIVANFNRQDNAAPLTYEHPSYSGDGNPVPAAGWIHSLAVRDGERGAELWADVEFTARAASMVQGGEYRFCSVVVDFESTDRRTGLEVGPELFEVGLTNQPFIDGQQPIAFSHRGHMKDPKALERALASAGLRLSVVALADKTLKQLMQEAFRELENDDPPLEQLVEYLRAKDAIESVKSGGKDKAKEPAEEAEAAPMSDTAEDATALTDVPLEEPMPGGDPAAGMSAEDFAAQVLEALGVESMDEALAMLGGMAPAPDTQMSTVLSNQVRALQSEVKRLAADLQAREDEKLTAEVEGIVDSLPQVHAAREQTVEHYFRLAKAAPELWEAQKAAAASAGPQPPAKRIGKAPTGLGGVKTDKAAMLARLGYKQATISKVAGDN